ncbi:hypothetical protein C8R44DRAFT_861659, partial [Mycena epipterygia]
MSFLFQNISRISMGTFPNTGRYIITNVGSRNFTVLPNADDKSEFVAGTEVDDGEKVSIANANDRSEFVAGTEVNGGGK